MGKMRVGEPVKPARPKDNYSKAGETGLSEGQLFISRLFFAEFVVRHFLTTDLHRYNRAELPLEMGFELNVGPLCFQCLCIAGEQVGLKFRDGVSCFGELPLRH